MPDKTIFISYARPDVASARRLYADLRADDLEVWLDEESLLPGQNWRVAITSAIEQSRFFIALLSSRSVSRQGFVNKELVEALDVLDTYPESEIFLIPARLDDCKPSHQKLRDLNWVDLFPDWNGGLSKILKAIGVHATPSVGVGGPLNIDDVIVNKASAHVELDVRLRNAGTVPVNITRADLHVLDRVPYAAAYQPSASYDLLLEDTHNVIAVAHVLQPNEVDRFIVRVGFSKYNTSCGFEAELVLSYNGNNRAVSQPFRFSSTF
ncbi:MAG TPA: hypothetical protein DDY43_02825 [Synechococcales bacterium UBA10510]|nr:hypothetical protein [Synechococcales bacterium UBA10510]